MEKCFDAHLLPGSVGLKYLGKVRKDFLPTKKPRFELSSLLGGCDASCKGSVPCILTRFVYCSLLSFVAVVLSSDNLLLITSSHVASTSLSVHSFHGSSFSAWHPNVYADSDDMMVFSR